MTLDTTVNANFAANTVTINGCGSYLTDSQTQFTLFLNQIKNKAYVKATDSFGVQIYYVDSNGTPYIIANRTSNIILPMSQF